MFWLVLVCWWQISGLELSPGKDGGRGSLGAGSPDVLVLKQVVRVFQKRGLVSGGAAGRDSVADWLVGGESEIQCSV